MHGEGRISGIYKMITKKANRQIISQKETVCNTIYSQICGLMFRKKQNLIMTFKEEKRISLHMFFVFYPIDVLLLNKNKEVVEIKQNFKPFTIYNCKEPAKFIIEL